MLTGKQKFALMWMYMRPVLTVSGLGSISAFMVLVIASVGVLGDFATVLTVLKVILLLMSLVLFSDKRNSSVKYFYINLGVSVKKLTVWAVALDLAVYFIILIMILTIRYAIS